MSEEMLVEVTATELVTFLRETDEHKRSLILYQVGSFCVTQRGESGKQTTFSINRYGSPYAAAERTASNTQHYERNGFRISDQATFQIPTWWLDNLAERVVDLYNLFLMIPSERGVSLEIKLRKALESKLKEQVS